MNSSPPIRPFLLRLWPRFAIRHEIQETRRSIADMNRLTPSLEDLSHYQSVSLHGREGRLHVIAARGRSERAVTQFEQVVVSAALKRPSEWLFLIEGGSGTPDCHYRDQYSLAVAVARWLHIVRPEHPFAAAIDEAVIEAAVRHGLPPSVRPDDLYGAACYDFLPKKRSADATGKGLESARIHEPPNPRLDAVRLIREFNWSVEVDRLESIIAHVLQRIDNECVGMLEEFYDLQVRPLLAEQRTRLNRQRLQALLRQHPAQNQVLVMVAEHHLPLVLRSVT